MRKLSLTRQAANSKNIKIRKADSIKEVELLDFHFNIPADGKITFEIHCASDVLPETFPEPRAKVTRAEKAAAKAQKKAAQEEAAYTPAPEETELAIIPEGPQIMKTAEPEENTAEPETAEDTPEQAAAVGDFIGTALVYQKVHENCRWNIKDRTNNSGDGIYGRGDILWRAVEM